MRVKFSLSGELEFTGQYNPLTGEITVRVSEPDSGPRPVNTVLPSISGGTFAGDTVTFDRGTWEPGPIIGYEMSLYLVNGATGEIDATVLTGGFDTYRIQSFFVEQLMKVGVVVHNAPGPAPGSLEAISEAFGPIQAQSAATNVSAPEIYNGGASFITGASIIATHGEWSANYVEDLTYLYQFYRCNEDGSGKESVGGSNLDSTYTLTDTDSERYIICEVWTQTPWGGAVSGHIESNILGPVLSVDVLLSHFRINDDDVSDGGIYNVGFGATSVTVDAAPVNAGASLIVAGDTGLATGDNALTVTVTAENGINQRIYTQTVHVLTEGTKEITTVDFSGRIGSDYQGLSNGRSFVFYTSTDVVGIWMDCADSTIPDFSAFPITTSVHVALNPAMVENDIANAVLNILSFINVNASYSKEFAVVTIQDSVAGNRTDAVNIDSLAVITVTQQGVDPA